MRRGPSIKRKPEPDPIYNSVLVSQIINQVLLDGKKDLASSIVYSALSLVEKQTKSDPITTLKNAFENIRPQIQTIKCRWRFLRGEVQLLQYVGWSILQENVEKILCKKD